MFPGLQSTEDGLRIITCQGQWHRQNTAEAASANLILLGVQEKEAQMLKDDTLCTMYKEWSCIALLLQ